MAGCCDPRGCDGIFDSRFARHRAARYRRKGLDRTARRMVDLLDRGGVRGRTRRTGAPPDRRHRRGPGRRRAGRHRRAAPGGLLLSRAVVATENALLRARGGRFRAFTHSPEAMLAVLAERGLRPSVARPRGVWRIATGTR